MTLTSLIVSNLRGHVKAKGPVRRHRASRDSDPRRRRPHELDALALVESNLRLRCLLEA